ncbi:unnamed protein product [Spirodela intermedia]|uniref:Ubiquitin carboxyl-terminal hydrolase n=1 Tax=Spirodela intermedia TaxID=51605 RepID=A0A7I8KKR7_SPIIN|nr:unnamed protein product [Spirodela intermedia]
MAEGAVERFKPRGGLPPPSQAASPRGAFFPGRGDLARDMGPFPPSGTSGGDFRMESLNPSADSRRQASRSVGPVSSAAASSSSGVIGRKSDGGVFRPRGSDSEISFGITFRRIGAGLANLGNTCFLNSVLQCLTYTEPFAAYLQSGKHKSSCRTSGFCAMCALQNHVMDALQSTGKILRPFHLVKNLKCILKNFRYARQEDAHEYMVNLLESMHKCCLPSGIASESPSAYEKSLVHKIFGGHLRSQVKCLQCSFCSNKFDPFLDLSLEIMKADTLHKALSHFTAVEQLDGGAKQYQCQQCKQKVKAVKQLTIHKAPYVLTVHLKRFGTALLGQKIDKKIEFEPSLDLKKYVSGPNDGDLKYTLYGVLVHAGYATHSGHYYCFVRTSSGVWYSLNDHQVFQVSEKTVLQQKAYMLFYVRNMSSAAQKVRNAVSKENGVPTGSVGRAIHDCVRESGIKHYSPCSNNGSNSLVGSMPPKSTQIEKQSAKNASISPCLITNDAKRTILNGSATHPSPKFSSIKEPSPSVSPLSSLTSEDLVSEGPAQKPSSGGSSIQLLEKDLMQTAQSKDRSGFTASKASERLSSADETLLSVKYCSVPAVAQNSHIETNLPHHSDCKVPIGTGPKDGILSGGGANEPLYPKIPENISAEGGQVDAICSKASTSSFSTQKEDVGSDEIHKAVMRRRRPTLPDLRNMTFGPGRLFAYLNLSKKKKQGRIKDCSTNRKRKHGLLGSADQGDQGPSTSAATKMEPPKKVRRRKGAVRTEKEICNRSEGVDRTSGEMGLSNLKGGSTKDPDCTVRWVKTSETRLSLDESCSPSYHNSLNMLVRSLGEAPVSQPDSTLSNEPKSIGSVVDKWGKEDGQGRRRKARRRRPRPTLVRNPFLGLAAVIAQKKPRIDQRNSGSKPFRIHGGGVKY